MDQVPAEGGVVVLSRLAWPGYAARGATLADPTDGYLLTLDVPPGSAGRQVLVDFDPPGWHAEVASLGLGVLGGLGWSAVLAARRRRRVSAAARPAAAG